MTVAFYTLAIASYFQQPEGASGFTYVCAAVGTTYFLVFLFGSDSLCTDMCFIFW